MMQLWSVLAPCRPARQTVAKVCAFDRATDATPKSAKAPWEPVSTRIVERGASDGSKLLTASQLSNFSCKIQRPPWSTFLRTWMPMPPSSRQSFATSVTGQSMTGVTGIFFSRQFWMKTHLSSSSKSLLWVARDVMEARRQFSRQSWNQSVGANRERPKHSAAESSRPCHFRHQAPTKATEGSKTSTDSTAWTRERAQTERGTPKSPVGSTTLRRFVSMSSWKVPVR
mmetsp:Transcript_79739/g.257960  ORF Transcript_79739/g.257960 Transcript_79739/m.257960 type:complete len:227 (+) Transcript_79739:577-1257(+)